ncbi:MAG: hypothetical protein J6I37_04910 [Prevotella sp.]|nr:hypothetical protein [Prevotella sp.]
MKKLVFLLITLITGCRTSENSISTDDGKAVILAIKEYVKDHPDYDQFLLIDSWKERFSIEKYPSGYILGPYYQGMLKKIDKYQCIDIKKSRIYINSSTLKLNNEICILYQSGAETFDEDYYIINDSWSDYIYKAVFLYNKDGNWCVNHRPDTIFAPKRVESNIHFQTEGNGGETDYTNFGK